MKLLSPKVLFGSADFQKKYCCQVSQNINTTYRNDPKFSDRYVWANSADPDQTAPRSSLIRVYTVCHSVCTVWTHYSMIEPHISNFRAITTIFLGVQIFRKFTVFLFFFFFFFFILSVFTTPRYLQSGHFHEFIFFPILCVFIIHLQCLC